MLVLWWIKYENRQYRIKRRAIEQKTCISNVWDAIVAIVKTPHNQIEYAECSDVIKACRLFIEGGWEWKKMLCSTTESVAQFLAK